MTALTVHAVKALVGDKGDRAYVGWLAQEGRWWCETHQHRPCQHRTALARLLAADPPGSADA